MKSNASLVNGGYLCGVAGHSCASGDWRQHYANYLVQYLQFYQAAGVPVTYLSFQNEPDLSPSYTGMNWDATNVPGSRGTVDLGTPHNIDFIKNYLGPTLSGSGLATQIACCEPTSWDRAILYANGVLADATAASYIGLISGHAYYVAPSGMLGPNPITSAINAGKRVWQTETSNFNTYNGSWDNGTPSHAGFQWAQALHDALVNANVNAYLYWVLAWNNGTDNGFLVKVSGSTYTVPKRLWAFAGYSRYVRPGATRISATAPPGNLKPSAFRNTDGSVVIVVLNTGRNGAATTFNLQNLVVGSTAAPYLTNEANSMAAQAGIAISAGAFTATVPGRSMVTYRILP
jgi:glucuronoarabinoxylan endo-1,4-beta-xylanase